MITGTIDEVADAVEQLPVIVREKLAEGPADEADACGVCAALDELARWTAHLTASRAAEAKVAADWLRDWHEVGVDTLVHAYAGTLTNEGRPTCHATDAALEAIADLDDPHELCVRQLAGALAHARCHVIYLAAGWRP